MSKHKEAEQFDFKVQTQNETNTCQFIWIVAVISK